MKKFKAGQIILGTSSEIWNAILSSPLLNGIKEKENNRNRFTDDERKFYQNIARFFRATGSEEWEVKGGCMRVDPEDDRSLFNKTLFSLEFLLELCGAE